MDMTGQKYRQLSKKATPKSPVVKNCIKVFLISGLICTIGQLVVHFALQAGMELKDARLVCSISLIAASVVLTGFNIYDNIAKHGGAGTLVPITGFANAIVAPAIEFKSDESDIDECDIIGPSQKSPAAISGEYDDLVQKSNRERSKHSSTSGYLPPKDRTGQEISPVF